MWTDAAEAAEEAARAAHKSLASTGFSSQHYLAIYAALGGSSLIFQVSQQPRGCICLQRFQVSCAKEAAEEAAEETSHAAHKNLAATGFSSRSALSSHLRCTEWQQPGLQVALRWQA